jgi:hypothetical protein
MYEPADSTHNGYNDAIKEPETNNTHPKDSHQVTGELLEHE